MLSSFRHRVLCGTTMKGKKANRILQGSGRRGDFDVGEIDESNRRDSVKRNANCLHRRSARNVLVDSRLTQ